MLLFLKCIALSTIVVEGFWQKISARNVSLIFSSSDPQILSRRLCLRDTVCSLSPIVTFASGTMTWYSPLSWFSTEGYFVRESLCITFCCSCNGTNRDLKIKQHLPKRRLRRVPCRGPGNGLYINCLQKVCSLGHDLILYKSKICQIWSSITCRGLRMKGTNKLGSR